MKIKLLKNVTVKVNGEYQNLKAGDILDFDKSVCEGLITWKNAIEYIEPKIEPKIEIPKVQPKEEKPKKKEEKETTLKELMEEEYIP